MAGLVKFVVQLLLLTFGIQGAWIGAAGEISSSRGEMTVGQDGSGDLLRAKDVSLGAPKRMKYTRAAEARKKCPELSVREQELETLFKRRRPLISRLSFSDGNWGQQDGGAPIMPFMEDGSNEDGESPPGAKLRLGSLWVTDIERNQLPVRNVAGVVVLEISDGGMHLKRVITNRESYSEIYPGHSTLSIEVQGIYEQAENEDVLCMLGCAYLPSPDGGIQWSNVQNAAGTKKLDLDCNIMVQLHYPFTYNLTSRVIHGQITSLNSPTDRYYFSPIDLSSQFTNIATYESTAEDLIASACENEDPGLSPPTSSEPTWMDFCEVSQESVANGWWDIETNWNCSGSQDYCGKIGPFSEYVGAAQAAAEDSYNSSRARILVQDFRSSCLAANDESASISVSSVFRLAPDGRTANLDFRRSALDGDTIVAEGTWKNSSDHLCMVACALNEETFQPDICYMKVCLRISRTLSVTRRNIFEGSISSIEANSFYPLSFHLKFDYSRSYPSRISSTIHYNYTRLDEAGAVLTKYEPVYHNAHSSWMNYPKLVGDSLQHYRVLSEDLTLHYGLQRHPSARINFDVVAVDEYVSFLWSGFVRAIDSFTPVNDSIVTTTDPSSTHRLKESRQYLSVAGTLSLSLDGTASVSEIFTEGYYSPKDGKMYMVGCRSIAAPWQVIQDNIWSLREGMDCEIEVVIFYPATFATWLLNPRVRVYVHSERPDDSPFHFPDVDVKTNPILYKRQREDLVFRRSVEGALSVLALSLMLVCIISQLLYMGNQVESSSYISLVMIGIQAMGYAIPLVTGAEALLIRKFDYRRSYVFQEGGWNQMIIYLDKILTLVALLLTVRLFEIVWKVRSMSADLQQSTSLPRERFVIAICFIIHVFGFISVMVLHSQKPMDVPVPIMNFNSAAGGGGAVDVIPNADVWFDVRKSYVWRRVLQEYAGLVEDLFLLPQAIALSLWDVKGKPLRLVYFVGLTFLQIVPHIYDSLRESGLDNFNTVYANPSFDFYTDLGDLLIPVLALVLALVVYSQQRWKNLLRFPSKFLYKPLSSQSKESELVQNQGRTSLPPIPEDDE